MADTGCTPAAWFWRRLDQAAAEFEQLPGWMRIPRRGLAEVELIALADEVSLGAGLSTDKCYALLDHIASLTSDAERLVAERDEARQSIKTLVKEDGVVVTRTRQRAEAAEARVAALQEAAKHAIAVVDSDGGDEAIRVALWSVVDLALAASSGATE